MGRAPTRVRRTFTPQFKRDAVRLVVDEGKSLTEVATHLGIARSLLQRWKEQRTAADPYHQRAGVESPRTGGVRAARRLTSRTSRS